MNTGWTSTTVNWLLLCIIVLILPNCTENTASGVTNEPAVLSSTDDRATSLPTNTILPTKTRQPTMTPIPDTPTSTPIPPTLTPTTRPATATPRPTATATLTAEQINANLLELMMTNGGCELPCWWGFIPGETLLDAAQERLLALGGRVHVELANLGRDQGVGITFESDDGLIQTINVGSYLSSEEDKEQYIQVWQTYDLTTMLDDYGPPSQVLIYRPFQPEPGQPFYHLLLFYEQSGFALEYFGDAEILMLDEGRYRACLGIADTWQVELFLYQPEQIDNIFERVLPASSISYIADPDTVYEIISWPQATGMSLDAFYEMFHAPEGNTCLEFVTPERTDLN